VGTPTIIGGRAHLRELGGSRGAEPGKSFTKRRAGWGREAEKRERAEQQQPSRTGAKKRERPEQQQPSRTGAVLVNSTVVGSSLCFTLIDLNSKALSVSPEFLCFF